MFLNFFKSSNFYSIVISAVSITASTIISVHYYNKSKNYEQRIESINKTIKTSTFITEDKSEFFNTLQLENSILFKDYEKLDSIFYVEKQKNHALISKIDSINKHLNSIKAKNEELSQSIEKYKAQINELQNSLTKKEQLLVELENQLTTYKNQPKTIVKNSVELPDVSSLAKHKLLYFRSSTYQENKRGDKKITLKASNVSLVEFTINVHGTIPFNYGTKTVYVRISDKNGNVLPYTNEKHHFFKYKNNDIIFSAKQDIVFNEKAFPQKIKYKPFSTLKPGIYEVDFFCDDEIIGETSFEIK